LELDIDLLQIYDLFLEQQLLFHQSIYHIKVLFLFILQLLIFSLVFLYLHIKFVKVHHHQPSLFFNQWLFHLLILIFNHLFNIQILTFEGLDLNQML